MGDLAGGVVDRFSQVGPGEAVSSTCRSGSEWDAGTTPLVGRERDLDLIGGFIDDCQVEGRALVLTGQPGVGKSRLLAAAAVQAADRGVRVERGAGVESEAGMNFAVLNQLLLSVSGQVQDLPLPLGPALEVALGLTIGPSPDLSVVSNAVLSLLRNAARQAPLLMVVDDIQWLDRSSAAVLSYVARRLRGTRVGLLMAVRSGPWTGFERGIAPEHEVRPLDAESAARVLHDGYPSLVWRVRARIIAEAHGNPLALLELPAALTERQRRAVSALPSVLPLGGRLRIAYAKQISDLPTQTRRMLLLAALDGSGRLADLEVVAGSIGLDALGPAVRAELVHVDEGRGRIEFCCPIFRSALVESSPSEERRQAHRLLADRFADQPARRARHLGESTLEPDEAVAGLLHAVARVSRGRGDAADALEALMRAAELSPGRDDRARRFAEAAYIGADVTGELDNVERLLAEGRTDGVPDSSLPSALARAYVLLNEAGDVDAAQALLVASAERALARDETDTDEVLEVMHDLLKVCLYAMRPELWTVFHDLAEQLPVAGSSGLSLWTQVLADPAHATGAMLSELDKEIAELGGGTDPTHTVRAATAGLFLDRLPGCRDALRSVARRGRDGGTVTAVINAVLMLSYDSFMSAEWSEADRLVDEGINLCNDRGYQLIGWQFVVVRALIAGARGDSELVDELTDEVVLWSMPRGVKSLQAGATHARVLAAAGLGQFEVVFQAASAISPAGVLAARAPHGLWVALDLVEAAVRTDRRSDAEAHVAAMRDIGFAALSPRLAMIMATAAALVEDGDRASDLFEEALAVAGVDRWPFHLARVHLLYGEHLRRARATTESRIHLGAALESFERMGARPWARRAGSELRAAGRTGSRNNERGSVALTAQEREIALLAAAGLTNREIGTQLFLSHRTVGAHLYRIFPKLAITSRAALRDALEASQPEVTSRSDDSGPSGSSSGAGRPRAYDGLERRRIA